MQSELAAQNKLLTDQYPKTLKTAWTVFYEHKLTVHPFSQAITTCNKLVTLQVISAAAEGVHSKLKLAKTAL